MSIGGNLYALFQVKNTGKKKNKIGEVVPDWQDALQVLGWLDLETGESKHTNFNSKIQESSHVFLCDYQKLSGRVTIDEQETVVDLTSENARMVIDGLVYEILLIDNPMNMNEHLEIYLKFVGGQNVS